MAYTIRDPNQTSFDLPIAVTKSDSIDIPVRGRALWVGTAGTANIVYDEGTASSFPLLQGLNPLGNVKRINTGGTADNIWVIL